MPPLLDLPDEHSCHLTFFVVGADAATPRPPVASHDHRTRTRGRQSLVRPRVLIKRRSRDGISAGIGRAQEAIFAAAGKRQRRYRGPAFSWSPTLLEVLAEGGYVCDASTLPTYLGRLSRAYFHAMSRQREAQRRQHRDLFGTFSDGFRAVHPFQAGPDENPGDADTADQHAIPHELLYLPESVLHRRMRAYLRLALELCRRTGVSLVSSCTRSKCWAPKTRGRPPSLDMDFPTERKRAVFREVLATLVEQFTLVPMSSHGRRRTCAGAPRLTWA